jgi:uncharacterized protein (TIGR02266 family)
MRIGSSKTVGSAARERRKEVRARARIEVRFKEASQAALAFRAYSLNFSIGGLCLLTRNKYAIGTELTLALKVARAEYQLSGVVAWERRGAIGVRFTNLQPEDRERLTRLLAAPAKTSRR